MKTSAPALVRALSLVGLLFGALLLPRVALAEGATTTIVGTLPERGQIAQHDGVVVVSQIGDDGKATLAIGGKAGAPRAIETHTLPAWGQPHVGTSDVGTTVIVYPHCSGQAITSCNLYAYDLATGADRRLGGEASRPGTAEIEGDMDRGALAIVRWNRPLTTPSALALAGRGEATTTLLYQPFGRPARTLPEPGGQQIDLDRGRIAQVRDRDPSFGTCGVPSVEVVDVRGGARVLLRHPCKIGGGTLLAPTLLERHAVWGLRMSDKSLLERAPIRGGLGHVMRARTVPFGLIAPSSGSSAFELRGDVLPALGSDPARLTSTWTFALSEGLALR